MSYNNILTASQNGLTTITINRPNKLNALNRETIKELHNALKEADSDSETKVIILTGSGEKAFVAGADISEFADFNVEQGKELAVSKSVAKKEEDSKTSTSMAMPNDEVTSGAEEVKEEAGGSEEGKEPALQV